jgi:Fe-S-cluster containining protein
VGRGPARKSSRGGGHIGAAPHDAGARAALDQLRAVYAEVDTLLAGWTCDSSNECCRFGVTGREPYPSAVEVAELERAVRARGALPKRRSLATVNARGEDERRCALLSDEGKCLVYASRPFGCRTFFCDRASGAAGEAWRSGPKAEIARLARAVTDVSARFDPGDSGPRPLSRVTEGWVESAGKSDRGKGVRGR